MVEAADTIWQVPAYLPYLQPPLTDEAVATTEQELGFALPTEYLNLLKTQNGGYIRFSLPDMAHDTIAGIGPYFPSLTDVDLPLRGLVPFDGDGHWHICLDYRKSTKNPSISYIDIECEHQSVVASSFAEYLTLLRLDVGDEYVDKYVIESVSDIEFVKTQLSQKLDVAFDPPDCYAYGYPSHCAMLGTERYPNCIWLHPNTVPRGFVRSDDERYDELKNLLPGYAPRYPEISDDSYILSVSSNVRDRVIDACAAAQFTVHPLREYFNSAC